MGGFNKFKKLRTVNDYYKRIDELSVNKKYNDIINLSLEMLGKFKLNKFKTMEVYTFLGSCYYNQEKYEQAANYYIKVIELLKEINYNYTFKNVMPLICMLDTFIKIDKSNIAKDIYFEVINYKYTKKELNKLKKFAYLNNLE